MMKIAQSFIAQTYYSIGGGLLSDATHLAKKEKNTVKCCLSLQNAEYFEHCSDNDNAHCDVGKYEIALNGKEAVGAHLEKCLENDAGLYCSTAFTQGILPGPLKYRVLASTLSCVASKYEFI